MFFALRTCLPRSAITIGRCEIHTNVSFSFWRPHPPRSRSGSWRQTSIRLRIAAVQQRPHCPQQEGIVQI